MGARKYVKVKNFSPSPVSFVRWWALSWTWTPHNVSIDNSAVLTESRFRECFQRFHTLKIFTANSRQWKINLNFISFVDRHFCEGIYFILRELSFRSSNCVLSGTLLLLLFRVLRQQNAKSHKNFFNPFKYDTIEMSEHHDTPIQCFELIKKLHLLLSFRFYMDWWHPRIWGKIFCLFATN